MKTSDFYFDLPQELIAQTPLQQRDASRLLCLGRTDGSIAHRHFHELPALLRLGAARADDPEKARVLGALLHCEQRPWLNSDY